MIMVVVGFFLFCNLADCSSWIWKTTAANQNGEFRDSFFGGLSTEISQVAYFRTKSKQTNKQTQFKTSDEPERVKQIIMSSL